MERFAPPTFAHTAQAIGAGRSPAAALVTVAMLNVALLLSAACSGQTVGSGTCPAVGPSPGPGELGPGRGEGPASGEGSRGQNDRVQLDGSVELVRTDGVLELVRSADGVPLARFPGVLHFEVAEVDGKDGAELLVLWQPDAPGQQPRIWVLRPSDRGFGYLWRGSRMSGAVEAFGVVEPAGDGQEPKSSCLVTREMAADGSSALLSYRWTGFGFGQGRSGKDGVIDCLGRRWTCGPGNYPEKLLCSESDESVSP